MVLTKVYNERDLGFADAYGAPHGFSSRREVPAHGHWAAQSAKKNNLFISIRHPASNTHPHCPSLLQAGNRGGLPDYSLNE